MRCGILYWFLISCAGLFCLTGCSGWTARDDEDVEETGVAEVVDDADPPANRPPAQPANAQLPPNPPAAPAPSTATRPQFPLVRTVSQELRQQSSEGWITSRSTLELTMTVAAVESTGASPSDPRPVAPGETTYHVEFQRVRLSQEIPGQAGLAYDSNAPQAVVPVALRPYQGLRNNSFQFRLNRERQLTGIVGFEAFVERCLEPVAPELRTIVRSSLPATSPAEAVSYFVDESVGLLPAEVSRAGDNWLRTREITRPLSCMTTMRCTLRQVTSETADVDIMGTVVPPPDDGERSPATAEGLKVHIRGGEIRGQCRIDRRTGLPTQSHLEQSLEMLVRLADGTEFPQFKSTVITLRPSIDSREQVPSAGSSGGQPPATARTEGLPSVRN